MSGKGLANKKDVPQPESEKAESATGDSGESRPAPKGISVALETDLGNTRQQATKAALVFKPAIAIDVLHYSLCLQVLSGGYYAGRRLLDLAVKVTSSETSKADIAEGQATAVLNKAQETLNTECLAIKDEGKRFEAFCSLSKSVKERLVAFCVASSLTIKVRGESKEQDYVVDALAVPFAKYWRPTKRTTSRA